MLEALEVPPDGLFWSAPLATDSDFAPEDPLALDYLGQQVGLWLFAGFTTRTSRPQNYAVVLYGLHLAEMAVRRYGYPGDDQTRTRLFERWERFWALATLEHRNGQLARGDPDAMRGVRGAKRAWLPGTKALPLDFPLISRQSELGGLGAYLTSLRAYGLVFSGSLRVTPAAQDIIAAFWSEQGGNDWRPRYEEYSLSALDLGASNVPRRSGRLTLAGLGRRSRLSSLVECERTEQQNRLWEALFLAARDGSTLALAKCLIAADGEGINAPEALLEGMLGETWGPLEPGLADKVGTALAFGRLARVLLQRFNQAYAHLDQHGWVADFGAVADAAFPRAGEDEFRKACAAVLAANGSRRFRKLQFHGPELLTLLARLTSSSPSDSLAHLLAFHRGVQRSRRGSGAWMREEHDKLVMQVAGYNGYKAESGFPSFKLHVVRTLLRDLGRLA